MPPTSSHVLPVPSQEDKIISTKRVLEDLQATLRETMAEANMIIDPATVALNFTDPDGADLNENIEKSARFLSNLLDSKSELEIQLAKVDNEAALLNGVLKHAEDVGQVQDQENFQEWVSMPTEYVVATQGVLNRHNRAVREYQRFFGKVDAPTFPRRPKDYGAPEYENAIPTKKLCYVHGKWITTYDDVDLRNSSPAVVCQYGDLLKRFEKQCENLSLLEKERNAFEWRAERLEKYNEVLRKKCDQLTEKRSSTNA